MSRTYRWAKREDLPLVEEFFARQFGPKAIQSVPGRVAWLGFDHPNGVQAWLGADGSELLAACCHVPATLDLGEVSTSAAYAMDLIVAPPHRRQGIGKIALQQRCERFGVSLSTGQSPEMASLYEGQEGVLRLARWNWSLFVRRPRPARGWRFTLREFCAFGLQRVRPSVAGSRRKIALEEALDQLGELAARYGPDEAGISVGRDHFRWRYAGVLYRGYSFYLLESEPDRRGLLVSRRSGRSEHLVDLYCSPKFRVDCFRLVGQTTPAERVIALTAGLPLAVAQRSAGFLVRPVGGEIVATALDSDLLRPLECRRWCSFAGEGDAELLRRPQ